MGNGHEFVKPSTWQRYTPTAREVERLCREYGIGNLVTMHEELDGATNVNLKFETRTGLYVVRCFSSLSEAAYLRYAEQIITLLRRSGVPALLPIKNLAGEATTKIREQCAQITPFIEARPFSSHPLDAHGSGRMLRQFHDALAYTTGGPAPRWSHYPSALILGDGLSRLQEVKNQIPFEVRQRTHRLHTMVMNQWDAANRSIPTTIIHGDWQLFNQLYSSDGDVRCVLDLDTLQRAERIHDVGYALWSLLRQSDRTGALPLLSEFLSGYGRLSREEQTILPIATARAALFFLCTATYATLPTVKLQAQLATLEPMIEWLLSPEGRGTVESYCVR